MFLVSFKQLSKKFYKSSVVSEFKMKSILRKEATGGKRRNTSSSEVKLLKFVGCFQFNFHLFLISHIIFSININSLTVLHTKNVWITIFQRWQKQFEVRRNRWSHNKFKAKQFAKLSSIQNCLQSQIIFNVLKIAFKQITIHCLFSYLRNVCMKNFSKDKKNNSKSNEINGHKIN